MGDAGGDGQVPAETGGLRSGPGKRPHAEGESSTGGDNAASEPDRSGSPFEAPSPPASEAARRRGQQSAGAGPEGAREVLRELLSRVLRSVWGLWAAAPSQSIASARDPPGTSVAQPLEQEALESRDSSMGGEATRVKEEGQLESQLQVLRNSSHPLASDIVRALGELARVAAQLVTEAQQPSSSPGGPERPPADEEQQRRLQEQLESQQELVSQLLAQNEQLQLEVQELKRAQEATRTQAAAYRRPAAPPQWYFPVQIRATGKTGGCEKQFLEDVSNGLVGNRVFLRVEDYQKNSDCCLLVFCPVTSRMGTDIENALEGLSGVQNTILVVLHLKPKDSTRLYVDTRRQVQHPTVVVTVHAFFTMQDGFYPCNENREAVASVVAAIQNYARGS
ncbi:uncharacterized protein LOC134398254 isoform X1 [Elgaria multicarinata webbii]|uniref:uncharacterized protein LOC134398254 isoform X1 n=1 Tax=Elgaria multicarinata webbii TaxID=159646 RepID=UPI002FCCD69E